MNLTDILIILIIFSFAIHGFIKGLIHELASLAGLILGIYISFQFSGSLEGYLSEYLRIPEEYSYMVTFFLIFLIVVIIIHLIGKLAENLIDLVALGFLNKLAGSVFGMLKAALILSLTFLVLEHFDKEIISDEKKEESFLYKPIAGIAPMLWEGFEKYGKDKLPDDYKPPKKDTVQLYFIKNN